MLSNVLPLALLVCHFQHPDHVQRLCQPVIDAAVRELVVAAGDAPVYQHRAHAGVVGAPDVKEAVAGDEIKIAKARERLVPSVDKKLSINKSFIP